MLYYQSKLDNWHQATKKKRLEWTLLQEIFNIEDYSEFSRVVLELTREGIIKGIGRKHNARSPRLYLKYELIKEEEDYTWVIDEINSTFCDELSKEFYLKNPVSYISNREDIQAINSYIKEHKELLSTKIAINERSFEIFWREKHLKTKGISSILKNLGLDDDYLNYYNATEPIAYFTISKKTPQNILIIENNNTYNSIRKFIKDVSTNVLGVEISTVIYGSGKGRLPSFYEIQNYTESHISNPSNTFLYFGDIDYEGISIFENYRARNIDNVTIEPFKDAYQYMIDKVGTNIYKLPKTKQGQRDHTKDIFFSYFDSNYTSRIKNILNKRLYIPQEVLNFNDLLKFTE